MASTGARARDGTPPPIIGKAGRYTVFITPPATPKTPGQSPRPQVPGSSLSPASPSSPVPSPSPSPRSVPAPAPAKVSPAPAAPAPPPVQVPPPQFGKSSPRTSNSAFGFFWDAVARVQDAHSRLDEYVAEWFGLNQSKYQWALNDYYESKGMDKEAVKTKDVVGKSQSV